MGIQVRFYTYLCVCMYLCFVNTCGSTTAFVVRSVVVFGQEGRKGREMNVEEHIHPLSPLQCLSTCQLPSVVCNLPSTAADTALPCFVLDPFSVLFQFGWLAEVACVMGSVYGTCTFVSFRFITCLCVRMSGFV